MRCKWETLPLISLVLTESCTSRSNIDSADPPPSLIQEYLRQNGAAQQEGPADVKVRCTVQRRFIASKLT